jgi:hypothetical protein
MNLILSFMGMTLLSVAAAAGKGPSGGKDHSGSKGPPGGKGPGPLFGPGGEALLEACVGEVQSRCELGFDVTELLATVTAIKADGEVPDNIETVLEQLRDTHVCIRGFVDTLSEDNACKLAAPSSGDHPRKNHVAKKIENLVMCDVVISDNCKLAFSVPTLLATLKELNVTGAEVPRESKIKEELRAVDDCLHTLDWSAVPEDNACRLAHDHQRPVAPPGSHNHTHGDNE